MRSVKASIIIVLLLIAGAIAYSITLNHAANNLAIKVETINQYAQAGDWEQVNRSLEAFSDDFEKSGQWLATLVNHSEIDSITSTLERLTQYGRHKASADFMAELYALDFYIRHLPKKEKLSLENLL